MMDTVLNLGLNDDHPRGPRRAHRQRALRLRRLPPLPHDVLPDRARRGRREASTHLDAAKASPGAGAGHRPDAEALEGAGRRVQGVRSRGRRRTSRPIPSSSSSWPSSRSSPRGTTSAPINYRNREKIPHDLGTAVNVLTMVFGNMGDDSGTGVAFTRDPNTGENSSYGEYLMNAQGEDVVAGIRTPAEIASSTRRSRPSTSSSRRSASQLERHYTDMQDLEFTIEKGQLYMLQSRSASAPPRRRSRSPSTWSTRDSSTARGRSRGSSRPRSNSSCAPVRAGPPHGRPEDRQGPQRVPGAAVGQVVFDADAPSSGSPAARRSSWSASRPPPTTSTACRRAGHPDRSRRRDQPRGRRRPADRQALRRRLRRAGRRLRHGTREVRPSTASVRRRRLDHHRRLDRRGLPSRPCQPSRPGSMTSRASAGPWLGRRDPPAPDPDQRRHPRGGRPGPLVRRRRASASAAPSTCSARASGSTSCAA